MYNYLKDTYWWKGGGSECSAIDGGCLYVSMGEMQLYLFRLIFTYSYIVGALLYVAFDKKRL